MYKLKPIRPKKRATKDSRQELRNALRRVGRRTIKEYDKLVSNWEHKPTFVMTTHVAKNDEILFVAVEPKPGEKATEIYTYVNRGTRPHDIWAGYYTGKSQHKVLAFPSSSRAKTKPGKLTSGPGGSSPPTLYRPFVQHPGSEARDFDKAMNKKMEKPFQTEMQKAMKKIVDDSGYGM